MRSRLQAAQAFATVGEALKLDSSSPTPALQSDQEADSVPDYCIALDDDGFVLGFFDADIDLPEPQRGIRHFSPDSKPLTRHLAAELDHQILLNDTVSLLVYLTAESFADAALPIALPLGASVDVVVRPRRGFVLEGRSEASLAIVGEEEPLPVQFRLKAARTGFGRVDVYAFHDGQSLGKLTLTPHVTEDPPRPQVINRYQGRLAATPSRQPDLSLTIFEGAWAGGAELYFKLSSRRPEVEPKAFGPMRLKSDPRICFNDFFKDIERLKHSAASMPEDDRARSVEQQIARSGAHLFETVLPQDLQALLWSLAKRVRSVHVQSEEPWIPWELCRLTGTGKGGIEEGGFFCEEFSMTRWHFEPQLKPGLSLKKLGLIVTGGSDLPSAEAEGQDLADLTGGKAETIPARLEEVIKALAGARFDWLHFTGHGQYRDPDANRSSIILEQYQELRPADLSGEVRNLGKSSPLVFLNACYAGRSAFSLTGIGGWASQFVKAGAAAFIGPYWAVSDRASRCFARSFYGWLFAGKEIGEAAREARLEVRKAFPGNPTWLAYSVYADPFARVDSIGGLS